MGTFCFDISGLDEHKSTDDDKLLNEAYEEALLPETSDVQK